MMGHWLVFGLKLEAGRYAEEIIEKFTGKIKILLHFGRLNKVFFRGRICRQETFRKWPNKNSLQL